MALSLSSEPIRCDGVDIPALRYLKGGGCCPLITRVELFPRTMREAHAALRYQGLVDIPVSVIHAGALVGDICSRLMELERKVDDICSRLMALERKVKGAS